MPAPASAFLVASGETGQGAGPDPAPVRRLFPAECEAVGRLQRRAFGGRAHVPVAVSVVAGLLARAGCIACRQGVMRVLDREGLQAASCECYGVSETIYDRIMK